MTIREDIEYKIPIPHVYHSLSNGNGRLFVKYVKGYIKQNFIDLKPLRIEDRKYVICIKKDVGGVL